MRRRMSACPPLRCPPMSPPFLPRGPSHVLHPRRAQEGRGAARPAGAHVAPTARPLPGAEISLDSLTRPLARCIVAECWPADCAAGDLAASPPDRAPARFGRRDGRRGVTARAVVRVRASVDGGGGRGRGGTTGARYER